MQAAPDLLLDDGGNPHIAYFEVRTNASSIRTGPYAGYYAGNTGGGWSVSQVSTNPVDPTADPDCSFNDDAHHSG